MSSRGAGSMALPTNAPVQLLLNGNDILAAYKTVMENNLNKMREVILSLTINAKLHYKLISDMPPILLE